jgi:hypothetical protein
MAGRVLRLFEGKTDAILIDVFDIVKSTQSRVTYADFARVGDIDGSRKRSDAIMKYPIAAKLMNLPVIMKIGSKDRWLVDNETWFAPAFKLDENQWAIVWSKSQDRVKIGEGWAPLNFVPKKNMIKNVLVKHIEFGEGLVTDVIYGVTNHYLSVNFDGQIRNINLSECLIKQDMFERKNITPIQRAFYIVTNDDMSKCRLIGLKKEDSYFSVEMDSVADKETIEEMMRSVAIDDDVLQIIRTDAKWRSRFASDKQKSYIQSQINRGALESDLDIKALTGGEASSIMDQIIWKNVLNKLLGASKQEDLIGQI